MVIGDLNPTAPEPLGGIAGMNDVGGWMEIQGLSVQWYEREGNGDANMIGGGQCCMKEWETARFWEHRKGSLMDQLAHFILMWFGG
jgi:hypothetical protein